MSKIIGDVQQLAYFEGRGYATAGLAAKSNPYALSDTRSRQWANGYASILLERQKAEGNKARLESVDSLARRFNVCNEAPANADSNIIPR